MTSIKRELCPKNKNFERCDKTHPQTGLRCVKGLGNHRIHQAQSKDKRWVWQDESK